MTLTVTRLARECKLSRSTILYYESIGLLRRPRRSDGNYRLSDGRVTLLIMPWKMENFIGTDPEPPRLEHFGFKVESIEAVKRDMDEIIGINPLMVTKPLGHGAEGKARLRAIVSATHKRDQLRKAANLLAEVAKPLGII